LTNINFRPQIKVSFYKGGLTYGISILFTSNILNILIGGFKLG